jgi:hypothetical protein
VLIIKILSLGNPERYAVRRIVAAVLHELQVIHPQLEVTISEVNDAGHIGRYASVLVMPTLVINEKVLCSGRFPTRDEVTGWLEDAIRDQ